MEQQHMAGLFATAENGAAEVDGEPGVEIFVASFSNVSPSSAGRLQRRALLVVAGAGCLMEHDGKCDGDAAASLASVFPAWRQPELERMTPEELLQLSVPDYYCWCLDG
ncbi:hypothetical protein EJB05_31977, partial [Eragrostis curvula]